MREFKFRIWNGYRMLNDSNLREDTEELFTKNGTREQCYNSICIPNEEDLKVMQYTGIIDKNGKEIYEGDIVEYFKDYAVIKMVPGGFIIENEHFKDYMLEMAGEIKVIGNIYENKELLEG